MRFTHTLFILGFLGSVSLAAEPTWRAGFAVQAITPKEKMWMSGYGGRTAPAEGAETELFAKAAVFTPANGPTLLLISLDLVGIDRDLARAIIKPIQVKHKLPRESIAIACSHTHCGPVVGSTLRSMYFYGEDQDQLVKDYTAALPGLVGKAVDAAFEKRAQVTLSAHIGQCGFAVNRRENKEADVPVLLKEGKELKGPKDHDVPILAARNEKGELVGIVFGYACHATTLSYQKWNGDWPGYAMAELEATNKGCTAVFFAGCGADQNPIPRRTQELAQKYGKQLAEAVMTALKDKPKNTLAAESQAIYREIDLPLQDPPTREKLAEESMSKDKFIAARAKMWLDRISKKEELPTKYPYPVQTWRIGSQMLVTLGGEVVVDYSLRLKKELGAETWVMAYANDVMAYIPSERVLKEGGYEGASSMIYYGLPSLWSPKCEAMIVQEVTKQYKAAK